MNRKKGTPGTGGGRKDVSLEDVERHLETLKHDLSDLASTMQALAASRKDSAVAAGAEQLEALGERGRAAVGRAEERLDRAVGDAGQALRERPFATVGIAAGVGLAVGYLTGRRQ